MHVLFNQLQASLLETNVNMSSPIYPCICKVATRGTALHFVVADLAGIEVVYQFSLAWFQDLNLDMFACLFSSQVATRGSVLYFVSRSSRHRGCVPILSGVVPRPKS